MCLSDETHPFGGEEGLFVAGTTTQRDAAIPLTDADFENGGLPRKTYVNPCPSSRFAMLTFSTKKDSSRRTSSRRWRKRQLDTWAFGDQSKVECRAAHRDSHVGELVLVVDVRGVPGVCAVRRFWRRDGRSVVGHLGCLGELSDINPRWILSGSREVITYKRGDGPTDNQPGFRRGPMFAAR